MGRGVLVAAKGAAIVGVPGALAVEVADGLPTTVGSGVRVGGDVAVILGVLVGNGVMEGGGVHVMVGLGVNVAVGGTFVNVTLSEYGAVRP